MEKPLELPTLPVIWPAEVCVTETRSGCKKTGQVTVCKHLNVEASENVYLLLRRLTQHSDYIRTIPLVAPAFP